MCAYDTFSSPLFSRYCRTDDSVDIGCKQFGIIEASQHLNSDAIDNRRSVDYRMSFKPLFLVSRILKSCATQS